MKKCNKNYKNVHVSVDINEISEDDVKVDVAAPEVTFTKINEFEADDASDDSTRFIASNVKTPEDNDVDSFEHEPCYKKYSNKSAATIFCSKNVSEMTLCQ